MQQGAGYKGVYIPNKKYECIADLSFRNIKKLTGKQNYSAFFYNHACLTWGRS